MPPPIVRASWSEIDPYIQGFERTLAARGCAEIADYLPDPGNDVYPVVLRELVRADLEFHWESGRPKRIESYLDAFPCLGEDPSGLSEIAFEEYRLRCRAGEEPSPDEYVSRLGVELSAHAEGASIPRVSGRETRWPGSSSRSGRATSDRRSGDVRRRLGRPRRD